MNDGVVDAARLFSWQCIDLFLSLESGTSSSFSWPTDDQKVSLSVAASPGDEQSVPLDQSSFPAAHEFLLHSLSATSGEEETVLRLVIPRTRGQIIRSDILELRMLDCRVAKTVASFAEPLQFFSGAAIYLHSAADIPSALASSIGGILLRNTASESLGSQLACLDEELQNRLSFPWISSQKLERKTLALVEGGRRNPEAGGNGETVFKGARALGIDMIVLDNAGHWLEDARWMSWRKAFLPMESGLQSDAVFTHRIVDTIRSWNGHLDGVVTFCDHYKEPVAEAALLLGLPTCSPSALSLATDKYRLRRFEGHEAYLASNVEEAVAIIQKHNVRFPLIMKPVTGYSSEGVTKLESLDELQGGVGAIDAGRHGARFAIEHYCEGPEVDANFVLCDGQVLFYEVSDEVPKGADSNGRGQVKTFAELGNVFPSKLPPAELSMLQDSLHQSLLRLGFRDGVYHLEARVQNSSMEYGMRDGILELLPRSTPARVPATAWLIEVNPRPSGMMVSVATKHTYGIDYWGLGLLFALEDRQRARQLSHPYAQGAQYWCEAVWIPAEKGGVYDTEDACGELFARCPELKEYVAWHANYFIRGAQVPHPASGINSWVAHINVFSRVSRAHVLRIGETVRREFRFSVV